MPPRRNVRLALCFTLTLVLCSAGCSSLHVPVGMPHIEGEEWLLHSAHGIALRVAPLQGRARYWSVFDENLPKLGMVAIWVEAENQDVLAMDFSRVRWSLRVAGRDCKAMGAAEVLQGYYAGRRGRFYSLEADRAARTGLEEAMFHAGEIAPAIKSSGFLFFRMRPEADSDWSRNAILTVQGIRAERVQKPVLEVPLHYAQP